MQMKRYRPKIFTRDDQVTPQNPTWRGHFISYDCKRPCYALQLKQALEERGVIVDNRKNLLRIGFGLYHDKGDVDALVAHLCALEEIVLIPRKE